MILRKWREAVNGVDVIASFEGTVTCNNTAAHGPHGCTMIFVDHGQHLQCQICKRVYRLVSKVEMVDDSP